MIDHQIIGAKVKLLPHSTAWKVVPPSLREVVGVVYRVTDLKLSKVAVRFQDHQTLDVVAYLRDLKVLDFYDDLEEVKRLAISWGANPFGAWWEGEPYV